MQDAQIYASDPNLEKVLETVRADHAEAQKFAADPEQYLKTRGINTENLKFQPELSSEELELVSGGTFELDAPSLTVCGGVGGGICGSVGG
jgi:hypothetical protein